MTDTYSDTQVVSILDRRRQLKRQRRAQFWTKVWRTSFLVGCTAGLAWLFSKPDWQIRQTKQVQILGNSQISAGTLETLLPLSFPTSLLRINPQAIKTALETHTHVDQVLVTRQLFPLRVVIQVQERAPIAQTTCRRCVLVVKLDQTQSITLGPADLWLLDDRGIPLPFESYPKLLRNSKVPSLVVDHYLQPLPAAQIKKNLPKMLPAQATPVALDSTLQNQWKKVLQPLLRSPVKIQALDLENPNNLVLKTELGMVQLGPLSAKLTEQLRALDQMRGLPQKQDLKQVKFINLENPQRPTLELNAAVTAPKPADKP